MQINDTKAIKACTRFYLWEAYNNYNLIKRYGTRVLTLHSEDVIANPKKQLKKLCRFLEVTCSEDYLNDCSSIIYKSTSKTRTTIAWKDAQKREIEQAIKDIPFLRRYTFESWLQVPCALHVRFLITLHWWMDNRLRYCLQVLMTHSMES